MMTFFVGATLPVGVRAAITGLRGSPEEPLPTLDVLATDDGLAVTKGAEGTTMPTADCLVAPTDGAIRADALATDPAVADAPAEAVGTFAEGVTGGGCFFLEIVCHC